MLLHQKRSEIDGRRDADRRLRLDDLGRRAELRIRGEEVADGHVVLRGDLRDRLRLGTFLFRELRQHGQPVSTRTTIVLSTLFEKPGVVPVVED